MTAASLSFPAGFGFVSSCMNESNSLSNSSAVFGFFGPGRGGLAPLVRTGPPPRGLRLKKCVREQTGKSMIMLLTGRSTLKFSSTLRAFLTRQALKSCQSVASVRSRHDAWALRGVERILPSSFDLLSVRRQYRLQLRQHTYRLRSRR